MPHDRADWLPDPLNQGCPSRAVTDLLADTWAVPVPTAVDQGVHRNGHLLRRIGGISQKALTRTLRDLERNGRVDRQDFTQIPAHVECRLTPTGQTLRPVLAQLCRWAIEHVDDIGRARAAHDGTAQDRAAPDRAAQDRAAPDRAAQDRAARDRAAQDRAAQDRAARDRAVAQSA